MAPYRRDFLAAVPVAAAAVAVTLWPHKLSPEVEALLRKRFPKLTIAATKAEQDAALAAAQRGERGLRRAGPRQAP